MYCEGGAEKLANNWVSYYSHCALGGDQFLIYFSFICTIQWRGSSWNFVNTKSNEFSKRWSGTVNLRRRRACEWQANKSTNESFLRLTARVWCSTGRRGWSRMVWFTWQHVLRAGRVCLRVSMSPGNAPQQILRQLVG